MRIGKHLIDRIDRPGGYAGFVEALDPFGAGCGGEVMVDFRAERIAVLRTRFRGLILGPLHERGGADGFAEPLPGLLARRGDVDVTVSGLEHAGRNAGRMIVAGLFGHFALDQITRALEVEHENLRLQQRALDVLTPLRFLTLKKGDQNTERGKQAGGKVGDRNAGANRALAGQAGDRHQPAHALGDLIEAGPVSIRAGLAEAGNAGINEPRVDLRQRLVVDAKPLLHVRTEILDHDIGLLDHALERGQALRRFEVERHAALVAVQILKIRALARAAHLIFDAGRGFDLDDIGAPIGELANAGRARAHAGEVEHRKTCQSFRRTGKRHCRSLRSAFTRIKYPLCGCELHRS